MYKLSIIIPIFNEVDNIQELLNEINDSLKSKYNYEIICVDDCSSDGSRELLNRLFINKQIILKKNNSNNGQSYCIKYGVEIASFDTIVTIDGDGQNDPKDINKLAMAYFNSNKIKLVGGLRIKRKDNLFKIFSSKIANFVRSLILNDNCSDTGCGLKIFDKNIFKNLFFFNGIHRFLPALFKGLGHQTLFIEVNHRSRKTGQSKYGTIDRIFKGIIDIVRVLIILKKK